MVGASAVTTWECEECFTLFDIEEDAYYMCQRCDDLFCEECIGEHLKDCLIFKDCKDNNKFSNNYRCTECGEIYELPDEAGDCCKEVEE